MAQTTTLRASVTASSGVTEGGPATVLVDGADTPVTANGLQGYTPTPGDRLLVQKVGGALEVLQFISIGSVPGVPDGSITDAKVALNGLNPRKGIVDMRPGALACLIHDWRFRDATISAQRTAGLSSIAIDTIAEELAHPFNNDGVMTMGAVGAAPPTEYVAGPSISLGNVINDTFNFLNQNVVPMTITGTLNPGDTVVSVLVDVTGRIGMTDWTGIATTYLNLDPATQNTALVNANGVEGQTKIEWIETDGTTSEYAATGTGNPTYDYYGHYDWAVLEGDNFSTGHPVPKYVKVSMIWQGPTLSADTAGTHSFLLPGFSLWNIGGPSYQPGTPYVRMDHNLASEEMTLVSGLPVTPGDQYAVHVRRNPWSETIPYTGSGTSPEGAGSLTIRRHYTDGTHDDYDILGTGSFEDAGWQHQSDVLTMADNISTIDVLLKQTQASDNSVTHLILPRITVAGWQGAGTFSPGARIHDGGARWLDSDGVQAINLDATNNSGGAALSGYVAVGPKNPGTSGYVDRDSSLNIWTGGNDQANVGDSGVPARVGLALDPYYNTVMNEDAPFDLGGGMTGSNGGRMMMTVERGTVGTDAPKGFVGVTPGGTPNAGATAQTTGFMFDSNANTITPVGTLVSSGGLAPATVVEFAGLTVPTNWLKCDGSAVSRTTYASLYDAMRTGYILGSMTSGSSTITGVSSADCAKLWVGMIVESVAFSTNSGVTIASVNAGTGTVTIAGATSLYTASELFQGLPFGNGNGSPTGTFNLPNFADKFPYGASATYQPGHIGGSNSHTLTTAEMPAHTHTSAAHTHAVGTLAVGSHVHTSAAHLHGNGTLTLGYEYSANGTTGGTSVVVHDIANLSGGGGTNVTANIAGSTASTTPGDTGATTPGISGDTASTTPANTGSAGSGTAFDITNPFQSITYIIYAGA